MKDIQLTPHFRLSEFSNSLTAKCSNLDNTIPKAYIPNLRNLCEQVLEPLRQYVGKPVVISSGYRCKALNKAVGGVATSQHLTGEAADIHINSLSEGREWFTWIMDNCSFDQLIWEYGWIHISCRRDISKNRQQVIEYGRVK